MPRWAGMGIVGAALACAALASWYHGDWGYGVGMIALAAMCVSEPRA